MASIGVAITQLFRLSTALYTLPDGSPSTNTSTAIATSDSPAVSTTLSAAAAASVLSQPVPSALLSLATELQQQAASIAALGLNASNERSRCGAQGQRVDCSSYGRRTRYKALGKPIGGAFIAAGIVLLSMVSGIRSVFRTVLSQCRGLAASLWCRPR